MRQSKTKERDLDAQQFWNSQTVNWKWLWLSYEELNSKEINAVQGHMGNITRHGNQSHTAENCLWWAHREPDTAEERISKHEKQLAEALKIGTQREKARNNVAE